VQRDYHSMIRMMSETPSMKENIEAAIADWRIRQLAFFKRKSADTWKPRKRQRTSAWQFGRTVQCQVLWSTGHKLSEFKLHIDPAQRGPALSWPRLNLVIDMGSDGLSWTYFARYVMMLNMDVAYDPSHGNNNGVDEAHNRTGLKPHNFMKFLALNIPHTPYGDGTRYRQLLDILDDLLRFESPHKQPGFMMLVGDMARDKGEEHRLGEQVLFVCTKLFVPMLGPYWAYINFPARN
jgi:hypothetical protein